MQAPQQLLPSLEAFSRGEGLPEGAYPAQVQRVQYATQQRPEAAHGYGGDEGGEGELVRRHVHSGGTLQAMERGIDGQGQRFMDMQGWTRFDTDSEEDSPDEPLAQKRDSNC